jgi:hypothetical protein
MKEDIIADVWTTIVEYVPEKQRQHAATDFVNVFMDYGVKETVLENLLGIDPYLDDALNYVIDDEVIEETTEEDFDDEDR